MNPSDTIPYFSPKTTARGVGVHRRRAFGGGKDVTELTAPFPYAGGKARWADIIWREFGEVTVYAEPFAGSLAVLLRSPRIAPREIVCDKDSLLVNFWRAMQADAEAVAASADYPSFHDDLTARHRELIRWGRENTERIQDDPRFYDIEMAGWWAWGKSLWIGGQWADIGQDEPTGDGQIPLVKGSGQGGHGVSMSRKKLPTDGLIGDGARLLPWFRSLQRRLQNVFVLNRDWSSAVTPTLLQHTPSSPKPPVGVFLDPPYRTDTGRSDSLYSGDHEATDVAVAAYDWAVEHGGVYRIAYACHEGDFDVPDGWTAETLSMGHAREGAIDMVMFSPACVGARQGTLL